MNGNRGLVIAALTAFLLGCSSGLIAGILLVRGLAPGRPAMEAPRAPRGPGPPEGPMLRMLSRRLDLTLEQRARIEAILDRSRGQHEAIRDSTRAAIERELTNEQRQGMERMELRMRRAPREDRPETAPEGLPPSDGHPPPPPDEDSGPR